MIKLFTIALLFIGLEVNAQLQILKASTDKFITVQFPSKVDFYQNSVSIHDKVGIKQVDDILFIQFLEPNVQETNLFVKTVDNKTYNLQGYAAHIAISKTKCTNLILPRYTGYLG